jgi:hypothetical protein
MRFGQALLVNETTAKLSTRILNTTIVNRKSQIVNRHGSLQSRTKPQV